VERGQETDDEAYFDPQNIYDFYAIEYLLSKNPGTNYDFRLKEIQAAVIRAYKTIVTNQIGKYIERKRYVGKKKATNLHSKSLRELFAIMKDTRRSDLERSNVRWEVLTDYLVQLEEVRDTRTIIHVIDRIYNATHNTHTKVLDKFSNGSDLLTAFDACHNARSIGEYSDKVSPELKDEVMAYRALEESQKDKYGKRNN